MKDPFKITLTPEQDDHLHKVAFNAKHGTETVRVELKALQNLLIDHTKALQAMKRPFLMPNGEVQ